MTIAVPTINRTEDAKHSPLAKQKIIGCLLSFAVPIALWFTPLSLGPAATHALAISSFMVIAWITATFTYALSGLIGCYMFWVWKGVKFKTASSGFADQTPWFVFCVLVIGMMATKSG